MSWTMKSTSVLIATALIASSGTVAFARDHMELVCSTVADAKDGGEKVPLFIHMLEHRAEDGSSRDETLSTIYQGKLFQATRVNKSGEFSKDAPIVLTAGKDLRFRGTYSVVTTPSGKYALKLVGKINEDPSARPVAFREVAATLPCVDLSY
jgi:hypothetical protein